MPSATGGGVGQIDKPTQGVGALGAAVALGAAAVLGARGRVTVGCRFVELAVVACGCCGDGDEQAARLKQPTAEMITRAVTFATLRRYYRRRATFVTPVMTHLYFAMSEGSTRERRVRGCPGRTATTTSS